MWKQTCLEINRGMPCGQYATWREHSELIQALQTHVCHFATPRVRYCAHRRSIRTLLTTHPSRRLINLAIADTSSARRVTERFSGWTAHVDRVWRCTSGIPSNAQMKELATDSDSGTPRNLISGAFRMMTDLTEFLGRVGACRAPMPKLP